MRLVLAALAVAAAGIGIPAARADQEPQLRNVALHRQGDADSSRPYRLVVRSKFTDGSETVFVGIARDPEMVKAMSAGGNNRTWIVTGNSPRRRSLLNGMAQELRSEGSVFGAAAISYDPLPDPVHGFTLRAFNQPAPIGR